MQRRMVGRKVNIKLKGLILYTILNLYPQVLNKRTKPSVIKCYTDPQLNGEPFKYKSTSLGQLVLRNSLYDERCKFFRRKYKHHNETETSIK